MIEKITSKKKNNVYANKSINFQRLHENYAQYLLSDLRPIYFYSCRKRFLIGLPSLCISSLCTWSVVLYIV